MTNPDQQNAHAVARPAVVICIATYRRPSGLCALIESLSNITTDAMPADVSIIVVENCPDDPAEADLGNIPELSCWPLRYVFEHTRGIVAARNRALDEIDEKADFIAFLDDDETVSRTWLAAMLHAMRRTKASAVQGPVLPHFEIDPPDWAVASGLFATGPFIADERLVSASTNNVMISADFVRKHKMRFDARFNTTGGEDEEFFYRLRQNGGTIHAAADAAVHDLIPRKRMTWHWAMRRKFRMGNTLGRIALLHRQNRVIRFLKGSGAILKGALTIATLGFGSRSRIAAGAFEMTRGAGMIAAYTGLTFKEYGISAVSHERNGAVI